MASSQRPKSVADGDRQNGKPERLTPLPHRTAAPPQIRGRRGHLFLVVAAHDVDIDLTRPVQKVVRQGLPGQARNQRPSRPADDDLRDVLAPGDAQDLGRRSPLR